MGRGEGGVGVFILAAQRTFCAIYYIDTLSVDPATVSEDTYTSGVPETVFRFLNNMQSTAGSTQVKLLITITYVVQAWWWTKHPADRSESYL